VNQFTSFIGRVISHYRIDRMIGSGGMGVVYLAHDEHLDRDVALKFLPPGALGDEGARKRFRKEALVLARLNHPNVATIHEFVTQDEVDFLVMEYVPGKSVAEVRPGEAWPAKELIAIASQIALALQEAHDHGIVHRDLKPGNILITPKGLAKVLDFGLATRWRPASDKTTKELLEEPRVVAGTLPYMAPEQLLNHETDARTDIYGLGAVVYEMATNQRPFQGDTAARLIDLILHQAPREPRLLNSNISPELERIMLKCLEKDPENRYQSAKELEIDLRRMQLPGSPPVDSRRATPRQHPRWKIIVAGACLLIAVASIGLWSYKTGGPFRSHSDSIPIHSLAVLPLDNLSGDPDQEYFAQGMTEELITQLAQISALRVISRTSVLPYGHSQKPISEIAKELQVDAIVEGSVMRSGNRVRITAKLVDGSTDKSLWAKAYDQPLTDVLDLQAQVARDIAQEVRVELTPQERERLKSTGRVVPEAHDAYLRGRYHWNKETEEQYKQAASYFRQAIAIDPNYAAGYLGLADYYWATDDLAPQVAMPQAREYALKSLSLDNSLSAAHTTLADVKFYGDWDWPGAENEYKRALAINPSDAEAHRMYSVFLSAMGRADEAFAESQTAQALDPVSVFSNTSAGWAFYFNHQYDRAIEQCQKALDLEPNDVGTHACIGYSYLAKGDFERAIVECKKAADFSGRDPLRIAGLGRAYALAGKSMEARQVLAELDAKSRSHYVPAYFSAMIRVALREKDKAMALLEKAYQDRDPYLPWLKVDDAFDALRADPRFQELLERIGFRQPANSPTAFNGQVQRSSGAGMPLGPLSHRGSSGPGSSIGIDTQRVRLGLPWLIISRTSLTFLRGTIQTPGPLRSSTGFTKIFSRFRNSERFSRTRLYCASVNFSTATCG
jgi:eukaryotic-like serine/threonine-protein kinase